ncbi:hypothetical protein [Neptunomonas japonica]|uniref:Lipoprotein n=1 Tax=Neptunomonas japonica JAMM 1380 TaxID=1441457 RepID=A0A7R6SW14_9GAMM|nr:hypothetical protein [Neptunomonas japonica]BBB30179.1 conserved hypothetical protein [Neptunomonas japonica JAMM 1380]
MVFKSWIIMPALCLFIAGCQTAAVLPEPDSEKAPSSPEETNKQAATASNERRAAPLAASRSDNVEYLSGQLSTMQEQVIQIKADTSELRKTTQILLARAQMLSNQSTKKAPSDTNGSVNTVEESPDLEQLTKRLNSLIKRADAQYQLVSGYTAKGEWVLIRYDRFSGESWLADNGQWNLLNESEEVLPSVFTIQLLRADKDVKGYVAARVDQATGQSWWLKQDTWLMFQ